MMNHALRWVRLLSVLALVSGQITLGRAVPAMAAPGDLIADVITPEGTGPLLRERGWSPSVAFDGTYLYYTEYAGSILHRIDVPPAGGPSIATGQVNVPIVGAASGIMTLSYDAGRDAFWAVGGDGLSIYLLSKAGTATLAFWIDPVNDRPRFQIGDATETKIAYDGTDDTIWYSPDATSRIYHYYTFADGQGTAVLVAATPYIDVNVAPNDIGAQCGYSQSSGVAVGGAHLFISVHGCPYYFEYTKTGDKVAWYAINFSAQPNNQDLECDTVSYGVAVLWIKDGFDGRIRAIEQPSACACVFGGGMPPARTACEMRQGSSSPFAFPRP